MPSLFARLRPASPLSSAVYDAAVNVARAPHWYLQGEVPDTMDGRFSVLATVLALATLRIEDAGDRHRAAAVALTEAFIADMDAQMREQGFDATLGKQVRHLVGSLASRVDRWRRALAGQGDWTDTARCSLYREDRVGDDALAHSASECRALADHLAALEVNSVIAGQWA